MELLRQNLAPFLNTEIFPMKFSPGDPPPPRIAFSALVVMILMNGNTCMPFPHSNTLQCPVGTKNWCTERCWCGVCRGHCGSKKILFLDHLRYANKWF